MTYQSAHAFSALADGTRRTIFERLAKRPLPVNKIAAGLEISRPAVSQHLKVLKQAGLVSDQRKGAARVYQIDPRGIAAMRAYLDRFWDRALSSFKEAAESDE
jgi:DNA-binding transcriptional ArsR family regulator